MNKTLLAKKLVIPSAVALGFFLALNTHGGTGDQLMPAYDIADPPDVRAEAMKQIAISAPKNVTTQTLDIVASALGDSSAEVRQHAAATAWRIAAAETYFKEQNIPDLSHKPRLRQAVLNAVSDADPQVREYALGAIIEGLPPGDDLKSLLVDRYGAEQSEQVKSKFIQALIAHKYASDDVVSLFKEALKGETPSTRGWAARRLGELKPEGALPLLVDALRADDQFVREGSAGAIKAYGKRAEPYLPELEEIKQQSNGEARDLLEQTIQSVREEE